MLSGFADPAFEGSFENGDSRFGSQTRGWIADAAPAQLVGDGRGKRCQFDQLPVTQISVRVNDGLAPSGEFATLLEETGSCLEGRDHHIDRSRRIRCFSNEGYEEILQGGRPREQNLGFVSEVPEERSLRESRPLSDLRHRGLFEPSLAIEVEGCLLEPIVCVGLPTGHLVIVLDDSR